MFLVEKGVFEQFDAFLCGFKSFTVFLKLGADRAVLEIVIQQLEFGPADHLGVFEFAHVRNL